MGYIGQKPLLRRDQRGNTFSHVVEFTAQVGQFIALAAELRGNAGLQVSLCKNWTTVFSFFTGDVR